MANANIERLKILTEELPALEDVIKKTGVDTVTYKINGGDALGHGLLSMEEIAVQWISMNGGTTFQNHTHKEREWLIVYSGDGIFMYKDTTILCKPGDYLYIEEGARHGLIANTDLCFLAVTIPLGEGFPDARKTE